MSSDDFHELRRWAGVSERDWNDWKWQMRNRITTARQLKEIISLTPEEEKAVEFSLTKFPMAITPYFSTLIDPQDPNCPIRKQVVPTMDEFIVSDYDMRDPCGEDTHSPVPGLVHRYPDRVLVILIDRCSIYCRYCTRKRIVSGGCLSLTWDNFEKCYEYILKNRKIRDVLFSGGDPLIMSDEKIEAVLSKFRRIPHVEILRIGTRVPVTLPQRITENLVSILKKYHPLYMSIHFSHPKEITSEVKRACEMLADAGIPLGSQTVLLRGINDRVSVMKKLMHELLKIRVRPYYIYQCDLVFGAEHFRTPVSTGIRIMEKLRGFTSGYAVPTYVIDAPGGGGKIPIGPDYVVYKTKGKIILKNYEGKIFEYVEPSRWPVEERRIAFFPKINR